MNTKLTRTTFGTTPDGKSAYLFSFVNHNGMKVKITNFGGIIVSIDVPDRMGKMADIILGFDSFNDYFKPHPYFGAIIGRYGNRIANGCFSIDGEIFTLAQNNGPNSLHGGLVGFDKYVWEAKMHIENGNPKLILRHQSPDGDEGFPGNLDVKVVYTLTKENELKIEYHATTDKPTVVNLTNHAYFNLTGDGGQKVLSHEAQIFADRFLPINENTVPTGEYAPVAGTPFDFREAKPIGKDIHSPHEQLKNTNGFDHNWVLRKNTGNTDPQLAAKVHEPKSGRVLEVLTTEPGIQFYIGNWLGGEFTGKAGKVYENYSAFCLETQHFPDSPNQADFPSTILRPKETYESMTIYRFSVK